MERTIGRLLRRIRAGDRHLAWNDPCVADAPESLRLTSAAFADDGAMPTRFAGAGVGQNISPPLDWSGAPSATRAFALIVQDPDAPLARPIVHLLAVGIPADCSACAKARCRRRAALGSPLGAARSDASATWGLGPFAGTARIATSSSCSPCRARSRSARGPIWPRFSRRWAAPFSRAASWLELTSGPERRRRAFILADDCRGKRPRSPPRPNLSR